MKRALIVLGLVLGVMALSGRASAQELRVIPVPWVATDLTVPHLAYNGHPTTFKAIARGGNGTYLVEWDFEGDGVYDTNVVTTNRYDLSAQFTFPNQSEDVTFLSQVRVTSDGETVYGTYPVRVFADVPADPALATDRQLQVMRHVAIDDGLWFLHNQMVRSGNEEHPITGAQITGYVDRSPGDSPYRNTVSGAVLETFGRNLHFPAFPAAYLGELPDPAANVERWASDPYAEDAARLVNHLLTQAVVVGVSATDEVNLTGFYPEVTATPIAGTDDGIGISGPAGGSDYMTGTTSNALRGVALANLSGFVAQVGDPNRVLGRRFEFIVQQMVDALAWAQNDSGYPGSWYYTPNSTQDMLGEFQGGVIEAIEALWQAEQSMGSHGVIVPNFVKARVVDYIRANANNCPEGGTGGSFVTSANVCDFALSAAHVFTLGWVGANAFSSSDTRQAFPGYSATTFGQLRALYDSSLTFISAVFNSLSPGTNNWDAGFVTNANYDRTDGQGNHWSMMQWTRAARAIEPEIVSFGSNEHARLFARYLLRNQAANGGWNWTYVGSNGIMNHSDNFMGARGRAAWALITLSPDAMAPVANAQASVTAGDEGVPIAFLGDSHAGGEVTYEWDFDNGDVLSGQTLDYAFPDDGIYDVTLTVTALGGVSVDTVTVTVSNVAPSVDAGNDRTIDEGTTVDFEGQVTDLGSADTHTFEWTFGDLQTAATLSASHLYADDGVYTATLSAVDDEGDEGQGSATITVLNVAPSITSLPNTAAQEGAIFSYTLTFTDPGSSDTHTCTLPIGPTGMALNGCAVTWTPTLAQALGGAIPVTLCVSDDDGGMDCQSWQSTPSFVDSDADGLPDSWEADYFGDLSQDAADDLDNDGASNLEEFQASTDPTDYDGPSVPIPLVPTCGGDVNGASPLLTVANAMDPLGADLDYEYEVFTDALLASLAASSANVPEGPAGTTSWTVDTALSENATYYWRARASDGSRVGVWSTICSFTVNTANEAPDVPELTNPPDQATVQTQRPVLAWTASHDPEGGAVFYDVQIASDAAFTAILGEAVGVAGNSIVVDVDLALGPTYYWRARATDGSGVASDFAAPNAFTVEATNSTDPTPANDASVGPNSDGSVSIPSEDGGHVPNAIDAATSEPDGGDEPTASGEPDGGDQAIPPSSEADGGAQVTPVGDAEADDMTTDPDSGGVAATSESSKEGCSCSVPGYGGRDSQSWLAAATIALLMLRRRRTMPNI